MDSKKVNKLIRSNIKPFLVSEGFTISNTRNFWRFFDDRIEVINFQSFNSYLASGLGCTTFSFSVNLGCFLKYIPETYPIKRKDGRILPQEYHCHFRGGLKKTIDQKELKRSDIWYIGENGEYLEEAFIDVYSQLKNYALKWFENLSNPETILNTLLYEKEKMGELWGFGNNPSPSRSRMIAYTAWYLGKNELGDEYITKAIDSGCFKNSFSNIDEAKKLLPSP